MEVDELRVQANRVFAELTDDDLRSVLDRAGTGHFRRGEHLIREGADNPHLYLIREGTVSVRSYGVEFARLRPGSLAGEVSAAGISLPIADVVAASSRVTALMIPAELIRTLASRHPGFRARIHDTAMHRVLG